MKTIADISFLNRKSLLDHTHHRGMLIALAVLMFGAISAVSIVFSSEAPWVVFLPLVTIAVIIGLVILKKAVAGSTAAIIAYLAIVIFTTDGQFRARGAGEIDADWQSLLKFGLWIGAGVIGFAHMPPIRTIINRPGPALWLAYIAMAIISSVYAPTPLYSFGCAFSLLCFFAFAYAIIAKLTEAQFMWTVVSAFAVFLAIGWVVFYQNPGLGTSEAWTYNGIVLRMCGLAGQATNLGSVCAKYLAVLFLLWTAGRCRLVTALPLAALGVASLIASDARTGMIAVIVGIVVAMLAQSSKGLIMAALAAVAGVIASVIFSFPMDALGSHFSRSGDPTEVFTLTGRLEIWDFVEREIMEKPFFGWGYNASKVIIAKHVGFQDGLMIDTAHNMLLQSLMSVGFIGTLPIVGVIFYLFFSMLYKPNKFRDLFFVIIFIAGISDTSALGTTPSILTLFFLIISIMPQSASKSYTVQDLRVIDGMGLPSRQLSTAGGPSA